MTPGISIRGIEERERRQELSRAEGAKNAPPGTSVWFNAKPIIPNKGGGGGGDNNPVKPAEVTNYTETVLSTTADLSAEERIAFMALTGNEILEVFRNFNISSNSLSLSKNAIDSVPVVNSTNPTNIIPSENKNTDFLSGTSKTPETTTITNTTTTGVVTVSGPSGDLSDKGNTSNNSNSAQPPTTKVETEVVIPKLVITQDSAPPHKIISITPTSAKRGDTVTVTHENCYPPSTGKFLESETFYTTSINPQKPTGTGKPKVTIKTATPHGIVANQQVIVSGVTPNIYNGTWTAQSGTTSSTLVLDIGSKPGNITTTKPPEITVGGSVSAPKQISITAKPNQKIKGIFTFVVPQSAIIGEKYRIKALSNNVPARSAQSLTILTT